MSELLDNAVWHALRGPQATLAERVGDAVRYPASMAVFAGIPDDAGPEAYAWADLAALVGGGGGHALLFRAEIAPPGAWTEVGRLPTVQMWWADPDEPPTLAGADAVELGPADVDDMLDLVERTEPGPFERDTIRLGTYLGVREHGRLVAMAGERMQVDGFAELSAVCTDDEHRGRGLASALVCEIVRRMLHRGQRLFLHALTTNERAVGVYERLGFVVRRQVQAVVLHAPMMTVRGQDG